MRKTFAVFTATILMTLPMSASADNLIGEKVVLRALDKVTATTEDYTVKIGDTLKYGSLEIMVRHCEKKPPEEIPETYAFLQIFDARTDGKGEDAQKAKLFSGWMMASSPALSSLEHPVYDIWVLDCKVPKTEEIQEDTTDLR